MHAHRAGRADDADCAGTKKKLLVGKEAIHMPKSNLCENRMKKRYDFLAGILKGGLRQGNISTKSLSVKTGISERTVMKRLDQPETMRVSELYEFCDAAGVAVRFEFKNIPD